MPVRVTFKGDSDTVQFSFMQMRGERGGTDEVSIIVAGRDIPFLLRVILQRGGADGAIVEIEPQIIGSEVHAFQKYSRAIRAVQKGA